MAVIKCSTCGYMTSDRDRCCSNCGNEIKKTAIRAFCPACGLEINAATVVCPRCSSVICPKCKSVNVRLQNPQAANFASGAAIGNFGLLGALAYKVADNQLGLEKAVACLNCGNKFDPQ